MTFNPNKQNNNLTLLYYARAFLDILSLLRKQRFYKISAYSWMEEMLNFTFSDFCELSERNL